MVSLVIGRKGRQILTIMSESKTRINVDQKYKDSQAQFRKVTIKGDGDAIRQAAKLIVELVEQMSSKVQNMEYRKRPEINKSVQVRAKLVLSEEAETDVIGENGSFADGLSKQFHVSLMVYQNKDSRTVDKNESILVGGTLNLRKLLASCRTPKTH